MYGQARLPVRYVRWYEAGTGPERPYMRYVNGPKTKSEREGQDEHFL